MKLGWLTDPHLNFTTPEQRTALWQQGRAWGLDAVALTGDIGEADSVCPFLQEMLDALDMPLFVVLGNHDFYGADIASVRAAVTELAHHQPHLHYLSAGPGLSLTRHIALVGHDGWGDGRVGDVMGTPIMLNDFRHITDVAFLDLDTRRQKLAALGDECAQHLRAVLPPALDQHHHTIVLLHVPPFEAAAWHEGHASNDQWSPFFVCKAAGDVLLEFADKHPHRHLTVLCGHTHSRGEYWPRHNLHVRTGDAVYRAPAWQAPLAF